MNPSSIAALDQKLARERDFEKAAQHYAFAFLVVGALVGLYAFLACANIAPPTPWSPLGQAQQVDQEEQPSLPVIPQPEAPEEPPGEAV